MCVREWVSKWVSEWVSEWTSERVDEWTSERVSEWVCDICVMAGNMLQTSVSESDIIKFERFLLLNLMPFHGWTNNKFAYETKCIWPFVCAFRCGAMRFGFVGKCDFSSWISNARCPHIMLTQPSQHNNQPNAIILLSNIVILKSCNVMCSGIPVEWFNMCSFWFLGFVQVLFGLQVN